MHSMNDYSSAIQLRSDRWSALREAASGLTRATTAKEIEALRSKCAALFDSLSLIEPYWAFPGMAAFEHGRANHIAPKPQCLLADTWSAYARPLQTMCKVTLTHKVPTVHIQLRRKI